MSPDSYIPYRNIASELGIPPGDSVLLTSDILKLTLKARKEEKEFSAGNFINSFIQALGQEGTLLIPAYNFDLEDGDEYDISATEPMTGSLAMAAFSDMSFKRTQNPLHSFLVKGRAADKLLAMQNISSFGPDSPFAWMLENNTLMVFAGTSPGNAMTFTHFVEEREQVWYRKYERIRISFTGTDGKTANKIFKIYTKKYGWTMKLDRLQDLLPEEILNTFMFNGIPFFTIRAGDACEFISRDIRQNNARSIAGFSIKLYFRDIIKSELLGLNLFRTTYGKIRSAKRIHRG